MTELNFLAGGLIILFALIIIGIRVYQNFKNNKKMSMDDFIKMYGDNIIDILQDTIKVLSIDESDYDSKEDYERQIISTTISALKENSIEFGIPTDIVNLIDTNALTDIVINIFNKNKTKCFSVVEDTNNTIVEKEIEQV